MRVISVLLLLLCMSCVVNADVLVGTIVHVVDGDTVDFKYETKTIRLRLTDIQCAEAGTNDGDNVTNVMTSLLLHKTVTVVTHGLEHGKWKRKRTLADIYYLNRDVNQYLLDNYCPHY